MTPATGFGRGDGGSPSRTATPGAVVEDVVDREAGDAGDGPMVIADLLGIHPRTAERWATLAGGNWFD